MYDIAIVGFGAVGVSFLRQLHSHSYEQDLGTVRIAIISPAESFSSGLAFGRSDLHHRVNTPPELMSVDPEDPLGFSAWLKLRENTEGRYPTRLRYSQYLKETYEMLQKDEHFVIDEYHEEAIDLESIYGEKKIYLKSGKTVSTQRIVLALGAITSPVSLGEGSVEPTMPYKISSLNPSKNALVAGTGLTAVDCARSLLRHGCPEVHMFSRNGFAPSVITRQASYVPQNFIWQNIKIKTRNKPRGQRLPVIVNSLKRELINMDEPEFYRAQSLLQEKGLVDYWSYLLSRSENGDLPFQDTLASTRYFAHKLWRKLSVKERLEFQKKYGAFWANWRHPIPIGVISELKDYASQGRLFVHKSTSKTSLLNGRYQVETKKGVVKAESFIDGTGGTSLMHSTNSQLIRNLLNRKLAQPNPCGGLQIDNLTYSLLNSKNISHIYCLGPLAKGDLFSTNAFWFNSQCASQLATYIVTELRLSSQGSTTTP